MNLGFAVGPPVLARFADVQGSLTNGFILFMVLTLIAFAMLLPIRPRFWEPPERWAKIASQPVTATG